MHGARTHGDDHETTRDPVCGMRVDPERAAATRTAMGRSFYLCSAECVEKFDRDPTSYAGRASEESSQPERGHRHAGGCH